MQTWIIWPVLPPKSPKVAYKLKSYISSVQSIACLHPTMQVTTVSIDEARLG